MGISDMFDSAKSALSGQSEQVDGAVDSAADAVKDKAPDQVDGIVDQAAEKAKDAL